MRLADSKFVLRLPWSRCKAALAIFLGLAVAACTDVGDSSAVPGDDGGNLSAEGGGGTDAAFQDGATAADSTNQDTGSNVTAADANSLDATSQDAGGQDANGATDSFTQEASVVDASIDATIANEAAPDVLETGTVDGMVVDGPLDVSSQETGSADASVPDGASADATDSGADVADTSVADASTDTSPIDAGSDVAEGGGLVPCMTAGQTNCAQCSGNTNNLCSTEEAYFVRKDIAAGRVTAPGPISLADGTANCYACLVIATAINATHQHKMGIECGDLPANFTNGSAASVPGPATCETLVECLAGATGAGCANGQTSVNPPVGNDTFCYCGPGGYGTGGGAGPSACGTANASLVNGNCLAQELAGFDSTSTGTNLANYAQMSQPSGMANQFVESAIQYGCSTLCLQ